MSQVSLTFHGTSTDVMSDLADYGKAAELFLDFINELDDEDHSPDCPNNPDNYDTVCRDCRDQEAEVEAQLRGEIPFPQGYYKVRWLEDSAPIVAFANGDGEFFVPGIAGPIPQDEFPEVGEEVLL